MIHLAFFSSILYDYFCSAGMAELADALASGASDRKVVWVQVPSPAPYSTDKIDESAKKPVVTGFFDTQMAKKRS